MHRGRWITAGVIGIVIVGTAAWWSIANNPVVVSGPFLASVSGLAPADPAVGSGYVMTGDRIVLHASITNVGTAPFTLTGVVSPPEPAQLSLSAAFEYHADFSGSPIPHAPTAAEVPVAPGKAVGIVLTISAPPCSKRTVGPSDFGGAEFTVRSLGVTTTHWVDLSLVGPVVIPGLDAHGKCVERITN